MSLEREIHELKAIAGHYSRRPERASTALEIMQTVLEMQQNLYAADHQELAVTMYQIGELHSELQEFELAQSYYQKAVDIWNRVEPTTTESALCYTESMMNLQVLHDREQEKHSAHRHTDSELGSQSAA